MEKMFARQYVTIMSFLFSLFSTSGSIQATKQLAPFVAIYFNYEIFIIVKTNVIVN
jgi:hypothetical protein